MNCNKLFPSLNNKYLDGKSKVKQLKLELQRKRSKMIHQQHCPNFYRQVFDKVDNMKSFLSSTNQRHFLKHRSYLNKIEIYMHLLRIEDPRDIKECSKHRGFHCLSVSRNFCFPYNVKSNRRVAKE